MARNPFTVDELKAWNDYLYHGSKKVPSFVVTAERWMDTILELQDYIKGLEASNKSLTENYTYLLKLNRSSI